MADTKINGQLVPTEVVLAAAGGYREIAEAIVFVIADRYSPFLNHLLWEGEEDTYNRITDAMEAAALVAIVQRFPVVIRPVDLPVVYDIGRDAAARVEAMLEEKGVQR